MVQAWETGSSQTLWLSSVSPSPPPPGLTPPTTPPHKPVEDELFKPAEGGKGGEGGGGGGGEVVTPASNGGVPKGSWLSRSQNQRRVLEQTELYAQLLRPGQSADADVPRNFGDHDYCALSLGEKRKRSAAMLGAMFQVRGGADGVATATARAGGHQEKDGKVKEDEGQQPGDRDTTSSPSGCQMVATPPSSEEEAERSAASRSPSPVLHLCPDSPASKTDSR